MDLSQQVLDAAIIELVTPVTVLVQLTHLAHEEIRDLKRKGNICDGCEHNSYHKVLVELKARRTT